MIDSPATARIDAWVARHLPSVAATLAAPAPPGAADDLEALLGVALPDAWHRLHRWHDGQAGRTWGLFFGMTWMPVQEAAAAHREWLAVADQLGAAELALFAQDISSTPPDAVRAAYTHPLWVRFAHDHGGNHLAVDLAPGPAGRVGQVISTGRDETVRYVLAPDLGTFLDWFADALETRTTVERVDDDEHVHLLRGMRGDHFLDALPALFAGRTGPLSDHR